MIKSEKYYLDTFCVGRPEMDRVLGAALSKGGDFADLYFEYTTYANINLRDGEVTAGGHHTDYGVGVRTLSGEKTGYAYAESTDMGEMLAAARAAALIGAGGAGRPERYRVTARRVAEDRYPVATPWRSVSIGLFPPLLKTIEAKARAKESRIVKFIARMSYSESDVMMYNSFGELTCETRPMASVSVVAILSRNGEVIQKNASRSFRKGAEWLIGDDGALVDELVESLLKGTDERFEARRPKGGRMSVVMGAGASGILLHEAMGHAFEADFNRKGTSIFADKMGREICRKGISIVDDATIPGCRGSRTYDDEGVAGEKTYMVTDGVLTSYLHDRVSAAFYGVAPTGNGRREDFRYNPIPRMRTTYMENGDADPSDIIAAVKKGVYVDEFSNGQVKIGEGDFTFYVKSGFLIEDGRLTMPIRDINIIGNGPEALASISMVGNDLKIDNGTWTCGKEQSVAVSCGIPTVLVDNLTVGGE